MKWKPHQKTKQKYCMANDFSIFYLFHHTMIKINQYKKSYYHDDVFCFTFNVSVISSSSCLNCQNSFCSWRSVYFGNNVSIVWLHPRRQRLFYVHKGTGIVVSQKGGVGWKKPSICSSCDSFCFECQDEISCGLGE